MLAIDSFVMAITACMIADRIVTVVIVEPSNLSQNMDIADNLLLKVIIEG